MTKFKVGDKVKILAGAENDGVHPLEIGVIGIIKNIQDNGFYCIVTNYFNNAIMDDAMPWYIKENNLELVTEE